MATAKNRINLTIEDALFDKLRKLAKKGQMSVASMTHELLEIAMEVREDIYFSGIAEARMGDGTKQISHEEIWK